jgi:hypothetical protein
MSNKILEKLKSTKTGQEGINQKILKAQIVNLEMMKESYELNKEFVRLMEDMSGQMQLMSRSLKSLSDIVNTLGLNKKVGRKELRYIG